LQRRHEIGVLEAPHHDAEIAWTVRGVPSFVVEAGQTEPVGDPAAGKRPQRQPGLRALELVGVGLRVAFAVVDTGLDVDELADRREQADAEVRRPGDEPLAFGEYLPLHAVTVDAFLEVEPRRLVRAEADPRPRARQVV